MSPLVQHRTRLPRGLPAYQEIDSLPGRLSTDGHLFVLSELLVQGAAVAEEQLLAPRRDGLGLSKQS